MSVSVTVVLLAMAEALLGIFKVNQTVLEAPGNGYFSLYGQPNRFNYTPGLSYWIEKPEYRYQRKANSEGFPDEEWPVKKQAGEIRILASGDSFTEGDGTTYDSSYVEVLRTKLAGQSNVSVMNAGRCGADPFVNFINYQDRLKAYKPDIIVQTLASGDLIFDMIVRGGMERFWSGDSARIKKGPWWEPIYALSYISRLYFNAAGYNQLFLQKKDLLESKKELDSITVALFKTYAAVANQNGCKLVVVINPIQTEVVTGSYEYNLTDIINALKQTDNLLVVDLLPFYQKKIEKTNTKAADYYWPKDGHHNGHGYALMSEAIYVAFAPLLDSLQLAKEGTVISQYH